VRTKERTDVLRVNELDAAIAQYGGQSDSAFLDLFSTSPTTEDLWSEFCTYRAPYFAYKKRDNVYGVVQGCCNHWDCPKCGITRAKQEYGRIVEGCRTLAKQHDLFFITVTCRGKELSANEADNRYLEWTSRLLDALRIQTKRSNGYWCYVQVTERQKRSHPHSHILTTFRPPDLEQGHKRTYSRDNQGGLHWENVKCFRSEYLQARVVGAGLGEQYDISQVETVEGASRYVAKYMFKPEMFSAKFPPNWKRVRYSQNFPKLAERETDAFVLLSLADWDNLAKLATVVQVSDNVSLSEAKFCLKGSGVILRMMTPAPTT